MVKKEIDKDIDKWTGCPPMEIPEIEPGVTVIFLWRILSMGLKKYHPKEVAKYI